MILNKDLIVNNLDQIAEGRNYLVLDVEVLKYYEDKCRFEYAVEVLGVITVINWINTYYEQTGSNRIDTGVFYRVIEALLTKTTFDNPEDVELYFTAAKQFELFTDGIRKFYEGGVVGLPVDVDLFVLGVRIEGFSFSDLQQEENYDQLVYDMKFGKGLTIKDFINKAQHLLGVKTSANDKT